MQQQLINLSLISALALLLLGLYAPIISVEKFYLFSNTVSLLSALEQLWLAAEWGLFGLVLTFSVLFPIGKIILLLIVCNLQFTNSANHQHWLHWLSICGKWGKWSMLDVFVVALLVVTIKLGALAEAKVEFGIYAFAASVVITLLVAQWIGRQNAH